MAIKENLDTTHVEGDTLEWTEKDSYTFFFASAILWELFAMNPSSFDELSFSGLLDVWVPGILPCIWTQQELLFTAHVVFLAAWKVDKKYLQEKIALMIQRGYKRFMSEDEF